MWSPGQSLHFSIKFVKVAYQLFCWIAINSYTTRMHSSRMRTARSLTVSRHILHMPPSNHACPLATMHAPQQPRMPPATMHAPGNHTCPPSTMHAPQQPHTPPSNHARPRQPCMPSPRQPCMPPSKPHMPPLPWQPHMPPLWTEFLTHASENITLSQTSFAGGNNRAKVITTVKMIVS